MAEGNTQWFANFNTFYLKAQPYLFWRTFYIGQPGTEAVAVRNTRIFNVNAQFAVSCIIEEEQVVNINRGIIREGKAVGCFPVFVSHDLPVKLYEEQFASFSLCSK